MMVEGFFSKGGIKVGEVDLGGLETFQTKPESIKFHLCVGGGDFGR